ncbi:hypothetical protein V2J09_006175 [Rumex salicifolius]
MEGEVEEARECFRSGKTRNVQWRRSQLTALRCFLQDKEDSLFRALKQDLGKHPVETYRDEIGLVVTEINATLRSLHHWISPKKVKLPAYAFPSSAELIRTISTATGSSDSGQNTAVLKPSELAPAAASLLAEGLRAYLDEEAVKVFQGGPMVSQQLLQLKWDHIFFTGSRRVGNIVMTAAAKHLTPVTLELGAKCPTIVDNLDKLSNRERTMALKRILAAKFGTCNGQACLSIDYILVDKKFAPNLVELLKELTIKMFGERPEELATTSSRITNQYHFKRLKSLLDEPGVMDSVMEDIEDNVEFINSRPKPLAIYCFTKNDKLKKRTQSNTLSGALVFNDTMVQYTIPFGGVVESGFGRYHGKFGFDTLSHEKAILKRNYLVDFWFRYPPWRGYQMEMFRGIYKYDYVRMVLTILGLKKPPPLPSI